MKPVIGITSSYTRLSEFSEGVYVHHDYHRSVQACGGIPIVLPLTNVDLFLETIDLCDGVIFSGGEDVDPQFYGAQPHQQLGKTLPERDRLEIAGIHHALTTEKPLLAICRGVQILNVAMGGTLYQDLPSEYQGALQHQQKTSRPLDTHDVQLEEDSKLSTIVGLQRIRVNSLHHQAINQVADSLRVVGRAPDGVIEAVEDATRPFLIGVQWHPESMAAWDPIAMSLFQALVNQSTSSK